MKDDKKGSKKPFYKKAWFWVVICLFLIGLGGMSNKSPKSGQTSGKGTVQTDSSSSLDNSDNSENSDSSESDAGTGIETGKYTLPSGLEVDFFDYVRNDVTGNWRRAIVMTSLAPEEYAVEYYNQMFSSDDELHSVWNVTLNTTTSLRASGGILFVETYEYVKSEEHDAKAMFTGQALTSKMLNIETGEEMNFEE